MSKIKIEKQYLIIGNQYLIKNKITVSDYLFSLLKKNGADDVFLVPGGGNMHLIDSVKKNKNLNYTSFFHEQTATIAAESYSRKKNKLGVSLVTSGPGSTNAITAVAGAWIESIPLIIISGQVKSADIKKNKLIRQNGPQEVNIVDLVKHITKFSVTLDSKMDIPKVLNRSIQEAISLRPGPVWIDVPLDVQSKLIKYNKKFIKTKKIKKKFIFNPKNILDELKKSKRPLLIIGHGVRLSESEKELDKLIKKLNIPFLTTWNALDLQHYENKLNIGSPGVVARRNSNISIQLSDLIISIGSSLNKIITAFDEKNFGRNAKKIIVDIDKNQLNKIKIPRSKKILCDAKVFIKKLLDTENNLKPKLKWIDECYKLKKTFEDEMLLKKNKSEILNHYQVVNKLSKILKENQIISTGSSGLGIEIFYTFFKNKKNQRVFLTSGLGSMGYGVASSIGTCVANNKKKTILIESDGSLMFNIQELSTIINYKLPIKIIILNNSGYASIRNTQRNYFNSRFVGTGPEDKIFYPSFKHVCKAIKMQYFKIINKKDLNKNLSKYLRGSKASFIEIFLNKNEILEPKVSSFIDSKNKIRSFPLEDMSPKIDINILKKFLSKESLSLLTFRKISKT